MWSCDAAMPLQRPQTLLHFSKAKAKVSQGFALRRVRSFLYHDHRRPPILSKLSPDLHEPQHSSCKILQAPPCMPFACLPRAVRLSLSHYWNPGSLAHLTRNPSPQHDCEDAAVQFCFTSSPHPPHPRSPCRLSFSPSRRCS